MMLSVVIPTMNKVELLQRTLRALRDQDPAPGDDWEVVVVNDGSSDGTAAFLAAENGWTAPSLRVVQPERNVGRAAARNLGARAATGEYLLFIDDDIVAPKGLVSAHLEILLANRGCGTIGYAVTDSELIDAPHFHYLDSRGVARLPAGSAPARFFVTQNAAVPRAAFLAVGGFDEDFSGYGFEDMEVAFRLEDLGGVRFLALPWPVPRHVHHHTLAEYVAKKVECGRQSLPRVAELHPRRLREMNLHHILQVGRGGVAEPTPLGRLLAIGSAGRLLWALVSHWPTGAGERPVAAALYYRLMNLLVLTAFCRGLSDRDKRPDK